MNYSMTEPCDQCPFTRPSGFPYASLLAHASGEFGCHKFCKIDDDDGCFKPGKNTPHCAGALIFLELQNAPHQMMRICEKLKLYDPTKLNMDAPVVRGPGDCRNDRTRRA